jgi:hypothetical protein
MHVTCWCNAPSGRAWRGWTRNGSQCRWVQVHMEKLAKLYENSSTRDVLVQSSIRHSLAWMEPPRLTMPVGTYRTIRERVKSTAMQLIF